MIFYRITGSSNRKEIGFDPQMEFKSGTMNIAPDKPVKDIITTMYQTNAGAKLTDFMKVNYPASSFVVSSKARAFLKTFYLPKHQFLKVGVEHRLPVEQEFYYFNLYQNNFDAVLYEKSAINIFLSEGAEEKKFPTEKELIQYLESQGYPGCFPQQLHVRSPEILSYDYFNLIRIDVYPIVSERFKKAYEERELSGLEFLSCPYLDHYN